jgi:hypothetical protein
MNGTHGNKLSSADRVGVVLHVVCNNQKASDRVEFGAMPLIIPFHYTPSLGLRNKERGRAAANAKVGDSAGQD